MVASILQIQEKCCGCMACTEVCPVNAIQQISKNGFMYPIVDTSKCIECGKCNAICPVIKADKMKYREATHKIYIAKNKTVEERKSSTSGGMFLPLAKEIIAGGV